MARHSQTAASDPVPIELNSAACSSVTFVVVEVGGGMLYARRWRRLAGTGGVSDAMRARSQVAETVLGGVGVFT